MQTSRSRAALWLPLLAGLLAAPAAGQELAPLARELESAIADYPGTVGVSLRDLSGGASLSLRGDEPFPTASLIKLSVLVGVLDAVSRGDLRLDERLTLNADDPVGGSGVLRHLAPGLRPTVEDAAWLMIVVSDNTATNLLLDQVGIESLWATMDRLELPRSRVHRKVFQAASGSPRPDSAQKYGLGVSTPEETVRLLERLYRGEAVSPALDSLALEILRANQDDLKLARWIPEEVEVANKSGYDERAWNDCGILYTPAAPLALCVMTRDNPGDSYAADNAPNRLIARIGRIVFRHFNPGVPLPDAPPAGPPSR